MNNSDFIKLLEEHRTCTEPHKIYEGSDMFVTTCLSYVMRKVKANSLLNDIFSISNMIFATIIAYLLDISSTLYGLVQGYVESSRYYRMLLSDFTLLIFLNLFIMFFFTSVLLFLSSRANLSNRHILTILTKLLLICFIAIHLYGFISNFVLIY
jgi:hypothetical protein